VSKGDPMPSMKEVKGPASYLNRTEAEVETEDFDKPKESPFSLGNQDK